MKTGTLMALAAIAMSPAAFAATESAVTETAPIPQGVYQQVKSFSALGGLYSFEPIDNETLIVWRTPFDPYLVKLEYPSIDLKFAHGIAIQSFSNRVTSRFDGVWIRGIKYPIGSIYKLTREQARAL